jgi:hypothetical protein
MAADDQPFRTADAASCMSHHLGGIFTNVMDVPQPGMSKALLCPELLETSCWVSSKSLF